MTLAHSAASLILTGTIPSSKALLAFGVRSNCRLLAPHEQAPLRDRLACTAARASSPLRTFERPPACQRRAISSRGLGTPPTAAPARTVVNPGGLQGWSGPLSAGTRRRRRRPAPLRS